MSRTFQQCRCKHFPLDIIIFIIFDLRIAPHCFDDPCVIEAIKIRCIGSTKCPKSCMVWGLVALSFFSPGCYVLYRTNAVLDKEPSFVGCLHGICNREGRSLCRESNCLYTAMLFNWVL